MLIRTLTINIWFGGKIWDNLVSFIKIQKPDILILQEVYDGDDENLSPRFRTMKEFNKLFSEFLPYSAYGATVFDTGVNIPWGNAVFSKFPIINSDTVFFDLPFSNYDFQEDPDPRLAAEGMLECELLINGKSIHIYSWHGIWDTHGGDTEKRFLMEKAITGKLKDKKSLILAGDTNMDPESTVIKNIEKKLDLKSVFGEELKSTFNLRQKIHKGNYADSAVDMVFVSKDMKVISKDMPNVDISDHYPLLVNLEID